MRKVNFKWLPHALNSSHKAARVEVSRELLACLESRTNQSLSNVDTGDETWVCLDNPRTSMWIGPTLRGRLEFGAQLPPRNACFGLSFSWTDIGAMGVFPAQQSFNKDLFSGRVLRHIVESKRGTFFHLDNAPSHLTSEKDDESGIKRLPHRLCNPGLAPCEFWLFGYLKQSLEGRFFDDDIALQVAVSEILMSIQPDVFVTVFAEWKHRLQQRIDEGRDDL
jgi:hypothetical protein